MRRQIAAELLKIRTARMWLWLLIGAVAFAALTVLLSGLLAGQQDTPAIETAEAQRNLIGSTSAGYIFTLVLGILGVTGEYRHLTITSTFLVQPRRGLVIAAKLVAYALVGLGYAVACAAVTLALAYPIIALRHASVHPSVDVPLIILGAAAGTALYAVLGVAVGALIRNQIAAIVGALAWVLIVEQLIVAFLPEVGKWLPGGAASAMFQASVPGGELLEAWAGALVFVGYALVLAVLGTRLTVRRDIT
jgi:ABC-2 type transport system permease protein